METIQHLISEHQANTIRYKSLEAKRDKAHLVYVRLEEEFNEALDALRNSALELQTAVEKQALTK